MVVPDPKKENINRSESQGRNPKYGMVLLLPGLACNAVFNGILTILAEGAHAVRSPKSPSRAPLIKAKPKVRGHNVTLESLE